ncbi:tetratricopeptide repeat protein [Streptomyces sp. JJ36]|uniref:tetratricopeptide repeat protein n=1 Tax=Streptomyces sp. JJ36 TaxID=2736645 RepID=UPI001F2AC717|nr:tetratricopeptide repeat protein [Streptomyces sp. JJ36]
MTDQAVRGGTQGAATAADGFVGRERELRLLRTDIERAGLHTLAGRPAPYGRVLLVAGRPGSGRTALAGELVRRIAGRYPDGVLRARLSGPTGVPVPAERTARELLAALRTPAPPAGADEDEVTGALRDALAGRRVLLLLDDVADSGQLLDLLPDNRHCLVVAVARGPLTGVSDVRPCVLGGLDRGAAVELLRRRSGAAPRITVDPRRAEALAEACGDLPAALLLVAGWLAARPKLSVSDATARLEEIPAGADPRRPDVLLRAFRLAHGGLPGPAARLLRLLAVAPAGFADAQIASALAGCPVPDAEGVLAGLAGAGLLHPAAPGAYRVPGCLAPLLRAELHARERPAEVMLARARMLERTVRQLGACRAAADPDGAAAARRLEAFPRHLRFPGRAAARAWLEERLPALAAAVRPAADEAGGELDSLARRLALGLARAGEAHHGREAAAPESYRLHELVLELAERGGRQRERAAALLRLADLDLRTGRLRQAAGRYRAALDAARDCGDTPAAVRALESLGDTYRELGDQARAADWYGRALEHHHAAGAWPEAARLHGRQGAAHAGAGRWEEALRAWRASAALHRRLRDAPGYARALGEAARALERAGRAPEALRTGRDALAAAARARDTGLQRELRLLLAAASEAAGDAEGARAHRDAADLLCAGTGSSGPGGEPGPAATDGGSAVTAGATCESNSHQKKN